MAVCERWDKFDNHISDIRACQMQDAKQPLERSSASGERAIRAVLIVAYCGRFVIADPRSSTRTGILGCAAI